jgi:hypothetical protein
VVQILVKAVYRHFESHKTPQLTDFVNGFVKPSANARSHGGCETFGDLGWGDRRYILQGVVGGVKYGEMRSGFPTVALYNDSLQRMDGRSLWVCFKMHRVHR